MIHTCALKAMTARKHVGCDPSKLSCLSRSRCLSQWRWYMETLMSYQFIIVFCTQALALAPSGRFISVLLDGSLSLYPLRAPPLERSAAPQSKVDGVRYKNVLLNVNAFERSPAWWDALEKDENAKSEELLYLPYYRIPPSSGNVILMHSAST